MGDLDESAAALQRAVELTPHSVRMHAALGRLFALSGRDREARAILKQLRGQSQNRYVSPFDLASICVGLGQLDEGLELLGRAAADRSSLNRLALSADFKQYWVHIEHSRTLRAAYAAIDTRFWAVAVQRSW